MDLFAILRLCISKIVAKHLVGLKSSARGPIMHQGSQCSWRELTNSVLSQKSVLPKQKENSSFEFRDIILNKDDQYGDLDGGAQMVLFCGSPPVRSHNPVVRDEQFTKQTKSIFSPLPVNSFGVGKYCARVDRASPICGSFSGNPKVRIEGFTCKKSDSRSAVPALA